MEVPSTSGTSLDGPTGGSVSDRPDHEASPSPDLARSIRRLRAWLTILTVVVGVLLVLVLVVVAGAVVVSQEFFNPWSTESSTDQTKPLEDAVKRAYPDGLESVAVKQVDVDMQGIDGPFGVGAPSPRVYAVTYRLDGAAVPISGFATMPEDLAMSGLLPTEGSLASRLEPEQLLALIDAWSRKTSKPMGGVRAYNDPELMEPGSARETIEVAGKEYATKAVWRVAQGYDPAIGSKLNLDTMMDGRDLIFHLDTKTGAWTYLGSEQSEGYLPF